jgi:hypothetical protein
MDDVPLSEKQKVIGRELAPHANAAWIPMSPQAVTGEMPGFANAYASEFIRRTGFRFLRTWAESGAGWYAAVIEYDASVTPNWPAEWRERFEVHWAAAQPGVQSLVATLTFLWSNDASRRWPGGYALSPLRRSWRDDMLFSLLLSKCPQARPRAVHPPIQQQRPVRDKPIYVPREYEDDDVQPEPERYRPSGLTGGRQFDDDGYDSDVSTKTTQIGSIGEFLSVAIARVGPNGRLNRTLDGNYGRRRSIPCIDCKCAHI